MNAQQCTASSGLPLSPTLAPDIPILDGAPFDQDVPLAPKSVVGWRYP